mgnify:CR=1 FL=1
MKFFAARGAKKNIFHISLNLGFTSYYGDLANTNLNAPFYQRYGIQVNAERDIFQATRLCVNFFGGNILGDEKSEARTLNFRSNVLAPQLGLSFNFLYWAGGGNLREHFSMYLFAGVEAVFFRVAGDLKNSSNETYHYWSDGSIRNMPETAAHQNDAAEIKRDYIYETNYHNLDFDNFGNVPRSGLGLPLGLSAEMKFGNFGIRVGAVYHYTLTDHLDNITSKSIGNRKGNSGTDKYLFTYAGLAYTLPFASRSGGYNTKKINTKPLYKKKHYIKT